MSCYHPHYALDLGVNAETGKKIIKFLPRRYDSNLKDLRSKYGEDNVLCLPCGHCVGCCLDYSKEWAVRCALESLYYPDTSWFITLTYDNEHCPEFLFKRPVQKFIKDIRNAGYKVRYFAAGEYGSAENTHRPHYHLILYGLPINDLKLWKKSKTGYLFTSEMVSKFWPYGFITIAHATFQTAGYIARYCLKKRMVKNDDEFILMSKHPGIGQRYFEDHAEEIIKYDKLVGNFGNSLTSPSPRYFDKLAEKFGIDITKNKDKRLDLAKKLTRNDLIQYCYVHEEEVNLQKEDAKSRKLRYLPRGL